MPVLSSLLTAARPHPLPVARRPPYHDDVAGLQRLRERDLLRETSLPALAAITAVLGPDAGDGRYPRSIEHLLRRAVERLGDDEFGSTAPYLFGLVQGTFGRRPTDLRERAAREMGLAPETFRKDQERRIVSRLADEVLTIADSVTPSITLAAGSLAPAPVDIGARPRASGVALTPAVDDLPRPVGHFTASEPELAHLELHAVLHALEAQALRARLDAAAASDGAFG